MLSTDPPSFPFDGVALLADPIHGYISLTVPYANTRVVEQTEKDLIDSPWVQRLRYILQLQSAHWVYPGAEHTRFQHSLGTMHLAGRFMTQLYPSLHEIIPNLPSLPFLEEFVRITALLHDIGHGPFCHFFDHHFLHKYHLTHELLGQQIIQGHLARIIKKIRRSPSGAFAPGEQLNPKHMAFLILKDPHQSTKGLPPWVVALRPLLGGIYTPDNCDYVLRDSYMCGVAIGPVDIERLMHYTFFSSHGLTIHQSGLPALQMFLHARLYLYTNVYYHRTTRAIDIHLQEIFQPTMELLFPYNPLDDLSQYVHLTDWHVMETVRSWPQSRSKHKQRLGAEWAKILGRHVKWKTAFSLLLPIPQGSSSFQPNDFLFRMRQALPRKWQQTSIQVDFAHKDPRPINLLNMGGFQIFVWNPSTGQVDKESLQTYLQHLPARMITLRIFSQDHSLDEVLAKAAEDTLKKHWPDLLAPTVPNPHRPIA
ncbi:MAG: HD domain-containing protein [Nitrospirota bacterium]|nr:HD domain-containing protein [Nitrospirota bacterium]